LTLLSTAPKEAGAQPRFATMPLSSSLFWEDFLEDHVAEYGPRRISREEIMAFAAEFDPQPMHLDEIAARDTLLGGLAASGWHSCALLMRIIFDGFVGRCASMGSPGVEEVKWLQPVRPGDQLRVRCRVLTRRASSSRPDRGTTTFRFELINASDEVLMTVISPLMIRRRGAATI
jgi:acyl dehydratase